jgi:mannose-6-phosphate isomerase-like protein (cupin superfamily)
VSYVEKVNEMDREYRKGNSGVKYMLRGPKIDWGVILLLPGENLGPHGHREVEETFFFVEGKGKVMVDDVAYEAKAGDAFRIEPLEKHDIVNDSESPTKIVFIKCPYLPDDKIDYY